VRWLDRELAHFSDWRPVDGAFPLGPIINFSQAAHFHFGDIQAEAFWHQLVHAFQAHEDVAREAVELFVEVRDFSSAFKLISYSMSAWTRSLAA
jgi:hypothetical protein